MKFLTRLFCRHNLVFIRNVYGDDVIAWGHKRSLWTCSKCGAVVAKPDLHNV